MKKYEIAPAYSPLWKKLYALAKEYVQAEPWTLFDDQDAFIVQSPSDNEAYLCSVMGCGGEEFGICAFRGVQGIRNYVKIISHDPDKSTDRNLMYEMDMLSFTLSPRDEMQNNDLKVTRKLKLAFPGGKWPLFRRYRPHYLPWYLSENEIESLCDCLEQTLVLLDRGEETLDLIRNDTPGNVLARRTVKGEWVSSMIHVAFTAKEPVPMIALDEVTTARLRKLPSTGPKEELDLFHFPGPIQDHEPPYFGLVLLGVNEDSFANQYGFYSPFEDYLKASCDSLAKAFLSRKSKPEMVLLKDGSVFADLFEQIAEQVDIQFRRVDELPHIADVLDEMEQATTNDQVMQ